MRQPYAHEVEVVLDADVATLSARFPPTLALKLDGNVVCAFPQVRLADIWCGEFKPKDKR